MKLLEIGTILEPKFDSGIEYAVVIYSPRPTVQYDRYEIRTVKSNMSTVMTTEELYERYDPIGQAEVGRALFGDTEQQVDCGNSCIDCQCGKRVN